MVAAFPPSGGMIETVVAGDDGLAINDRHKRRAVGTGGGSTDRHVLS